MSMAGSIEIFSTGLGRSWALVPALTTPHYPKLPLFLNVHLEYSLRTLMIFAGRPAGTTMNSRFLGLQGGWWQTGSMSRTDGPGMRRIEVLTTLGLKKCSFQWAQSATVSTPNNLYSRRGIQAWKWQHKHRSKGLTHKRAPYCDLQPL